MGIGYNYIAPDYRKIEFKNSDVSGGVGNIVPVPKSHKIICREKYGDLSDSKIDIVGRAPSSVERMLIVSL